MKTITRRALLTGGVAAAAGAIGTALAGAGRHFGLIPPDWCGIYGPGETLSYAAHRLFGRHAMAPAFTAVFPWSVTILGGRQSARTLHFFVTIALVLFTVVHVTMIVLAGFWPRVRAMITGTAEGR